MTDVLVDVKNGNGNRRILSATNEPIARLFHLNALQSFSAVLRAIEEDS